MRNRILAALLACSLLSAPTVALAGPWNDTFNADAVRGQVSGDGVIVVRGGERTEALSDAAAALAGAVRSAGSAKLVMDDASLGDVSALDDAGIVAKCQHLPVTKIAVVRVFPAAAGEQPTAVVTVYDKKSTVVASFSGQAGTALAAQADAGAGVSEGAAQVVGSLAAGQGQAQEEYDKTFVWFEDWVAMQAGTGTVVGEWSVPYRGKYKERLEGADFYEVVGREDLASSYRTRNAWRLGLGISGYAAIIGGGIYGMSGIGSDDPDEFTSTLTTGGIIMGGGLVLAMVGGLIDPNPVEITEARRLADEYNQGLKKKLGLASNEPAVEVKPGLMATNGGGGLSLSGTFR